MRCAVLEVGGKSRNCALSVGSEGERSGFSCIVNLGYDTRRKKLVCGVRDYDTWNKSPLFIILSTGAVFEYSSYPQLETIGKRSFMILAFSSPYSYPLSLPLSYRYSTRKPYPPARKSNPDTPTITASQSLPNIPSLSPSLHRTTNPHSAPPEKQNKTESENFLKKESTRSGKVKKKWKKVR